ncbi:LSM domain-containing protein [Cryptosporidium andersoni]|uniref:U6 snRNA-associated Sm-like protein LSm8 n=1 Tax=Cryptosporidium andersoni TaxID=117008 RepID=A0A1J4MTR4_9CRYT|nr:LSM domain-containing protein [Cryptosporidium andersoni]
MESILLTFSERLVSVLTTDGKVYIGSLKGYDQLTNIILAKCREKVYEANSKVIKYIELGLFLIRGDSIALIGEIESEDPVKSAINEEEKNKKIKYDYM